MRPIQRKFVVPANRVQRVNIAVLPEAGEGEHALPHPMAECEVRVMDGRLGRIEWRDSVRELERSFADTMPSQFM